MTMKKLLLSTLTIIACVVSVHAEKCKITKLSTPTITIGGKVCQEGSIFDDKETITWSSDEQGFWCRNMEKGTYNYYAAKAFKSRKCKTAFEYLRTNKMSTRSGGFDITIDRNPDRTFQDRRIALVFGNSNYIAEQNLRTPIPDAISISEKLSDMGFNVYVVFDAGKAAMDEAVKKFCGYADNYETALIYYAGHGSQFAGDTYLIPVDAVVETSIDVMERCVAAKRIISFLNDVESLKTRLVLIDACRTSNKLLASRGNSDTNMFNTDELNEGIIIYSTKHGFEAYDEDGLTSMHSPFASAVINNIDKPNLSIGDFVSDVMLEVKSLTSIPPYPYPQEPRSIPTLTHRFYFNPVEQNERTVGSIITRSSMRDDESRTKKRTTLITNPATPEGYYETGMYYYQKEDYTNAVRWFLRSASADYAPAQAILGVCYYDGEGVTKDYSIARDYFEKAVLKNNAKAINGLGILYLYGRGVEKDIKKGMKLMEKAGKLGYGVSYNNLGLIYYEGEYVKQNYQKSLQMFKLGAELNNADCMYNIGCFYYQGLYVTENKEEAMKWFKKAAEEGFAKAQNDLGYWYSEGIGVTQDYDEAVKWWTKAAEQGNAEAQHWLGFCYAYGYGVAVNKEEAVKWFKKSAEQGNSMAQYQLALHYHTGEGVAQDLDEAVKWYKKAAEQNHKDAIKALEQLNNSSDKGEKEAQK